MKKHLTFLVLSSLFFTTLMLYPGFADTEVRDGSFSTDKGTSISINSTLEFQEVTDGGKPILRVNHSYTLTIQITLNQLGNDVRDFHDLEFLVAVTSSGLIGGKSYYYSGYYIDSKTKLIEDDQTKSYSFDIFISGHFKETDANIEIVFSGKENVANARDPTSSFENIGYEILLTSEGSANVVELDGTEVLDRTQEIFAEKETKLKIAVSLSHDGLSNNDTGKPTLNSGEKYAIMITVAVLELGTDANDFHDFEASIMLEDESISDILPGSDSKKYFATRLFDETKLLEGENATYTIIMVPSTNINATDFNLTFEFKGKEAVDNSIDPTSEFSLGIEGELNPHKENQGEIFTGTNEAPFGNWFMFLASIILIVILPNPRRKD